MKKIDEYRTLARSQAPWSLGYWYRILGSISIYPSYFLAQTSATPNQVTVMSTLLAFLAAAIIQSSNYWVRLVAVIVLFISLILDDCDGDIARYKNMASAFGQRFDLLSDGAKDVALLAAVSSLAFNQFKHSWIIWVGSLAVGGTVLYCYSSALLYGLQARKSKHPTTFSDAIAKVCMALWHVRYPIMAVFLVLNFIQVYLILVAVTSLGAITFNVYSAWKESNSLLKPSLPSLN